MVPIIAWLSRRCAAEADDIAVRFLNVEILRAPLRRRQRLEDLGAVGDALLVERLDAFHARGGVQVLILPTVLAFRWVLRRFLQMQLQAVKAANGIEPVPRFPKGEA